MSQDRLHASMTRPSLRKTAAGLIWAALAAAGATAALAGAAPGCGTETEDFCQPAVWYPNPPPRDLCSCAPGSTCSGGTDAGLLETDDAGAYRTCPMPFTCISEVDGGDASADGPIGSCAGQCLPHPPAFWESPGLLWIGSGVQAQPCPQSALKESYEGYADLSAPDLCGACQCGPPTGSCRLPATLTARAAICAGVGPSTPTTPFDPPDGGWDGGCTADDAVDGGELCEGGQCVQSLTIAPLVVNDSACAPTQAPITKDPPNWGTFARLCLGDSPGSCSNSGLHCSPASAPGFLVCVYQQGNSDCSDPALAPYTEKHVFYKSFQDTRSCSTCGCGAPTGSSCTSDVSVYPDNACASDAGVISHPVDSNMTLCLDVNAGSALGSKSASPPIYTPGACQPSGGPTGSAEPAGPTTFCCIPSP